MIISTLKTIFEISMTVCCFLFVVKFALIFFYKTWISAFNLKNLVFFFKCCRRSAVIANCSFKLNCVSDGLHSMLSSFDIEFKSFCMIFFSAGSMISKMSLSFEKLFIVQYLRSIVNIANHHFCEKNNDQNCNDNSKQTQLKIIKLL